MIYLISDTHFNHDNIIKYCSRPDYNVSDMNERLIWYWNLKVAPEDTVYHLGDFGMEKGPDKLRVIFDQLNGQKHLISGNHDARNRKVMQLPWASINQIKKIKEDGARAILCHYPIESWEGAHRGYLMLHGHCHGSLKRVIPHRFDVGVDAYAKDGPISFKFLSSVASHEPFSAVDHHGDL